MHERTSLLSSLKATPGERGAVGEVPICFFEPGISNTLAEMLGEDVKSVKVLPTFMYSMKCGKRHDKDCLDVCYDDCSAANHKPWAPEHVRMCSPIQRHLQLDMRMAEENEVVFSVKC